MQNKRGFNFEGQKKNPKAAKEEASMNAQRSKQNLFNLEDRLVCGFGPVGSWDIWARLLDEDLHALCWLGNALNMKTTQHVSRATLACFQPKA